MLKPLIGETFAAWPGIPLGKMGFGVHEVAALPWVGQSFGGARGWSGAARLGLHLAGSPLPARRSSPAPDRTPSHPLRVGSVLQDVSTVPYFNEIVVKVRYKPDSKIWPNLVVEAKA